MKLEKSPNIFYGFVLSQTWLFCKAFPKLMESIQLSSLNTNDSDDDFEFIDDEGDLDISFTKSSSNGSAEKLTSGFGLMMSTLTAIVEEKGLVATVPVATMASTAVGALTGSLIGGAPGLAVGLVTAAVIAYRSSPNRNKSPKAESAKSSIRQIFNQMTLQQKKELLKELLGCLKQSSVRSLILEILKNESIRGMALEILSGFLMRKMGVSLVRPK